MSEGGSQHTATAVSQLVRVARTAYGAHELRSHVAKSEQRGRGLADWAAVTLDGRVPQTATDKPTEHFKTKALVKFLS